MCVYTIGNVLATQSYSLAYRSQAAVVGRIGRSALCREGSNNLINTVWAPKQVIPRRGKYVSKVTSRRLVLSVGVLESKIALPSVTRVRA